MSEVAIRAEGLSKRYRIGSRASFPTLRDALTSVVRAPWRRRHAANSDEDVLWALQDVSFDVARGEVLGIIGRNGAGKSTLLKIISRITEPTAGYAEIHGRVGSLLEVGTGFNPELTGRENIYLNGSILGMRKAEISRKFDEIVAFAEVERFIDTPVKHYSSGMYMRLAFAVAAHLEPETLLVDEVLAVGDAAFQKKCLGKMGDVAQGGRTVLFVSHNLLAMQGFCDRVIWLDRGRVKQVGLPGPVIARYLQTAFSPRTERCWDDPTTAPGDERVRLHRARVLPAYGSPEDSITIRTPIVMEFDYWSLQPDTCLHLSLQLFNAQGILVFETGPGNDSQWLGRPYPVGLFRDRCQVPGDLLNDGLYTCVLEVYKDQGKLLHRQEDILVFEVLDAVETRADWYGTWNGVVRPMLPWSTEQLEQAFALPAEREAIGAGSAR